MKGPRKKSKEQRMEPSITKTLRVTRTTLGAWELEIPRVFVHIHWTVSPPSIQSQNRLEPRPGLS